MMLSVLEMRPGSLTALQAHLELTIVDPLTLLLEWPVLQLIVPKEPSDCKVVILPKGVWRSATITFGAQCAMTCGIMLMPGLLAGS